MTIWISQMLCPARHCAFAAAWDSDETTSARAAADLRAGMARLGANDRCGICGGPLGVEHAPTRYATMGEAMPHLIAAEERNIETRRHLDRLGLTREPLDPRAGSAGKTLRDLP